MSPRKTAKAPKPVGDAITAKVRRWLSAPKNAKTIVAFALERDADGTFVVETWRLHSLLRDVDQKAVYEAVMLQAKAEGHAAELDGTLGSKAEALAEKAAGAFVDGVFSRFGALLGGSKPPASSVVKT